MKRIYWIILGLILVATLVLEFTVLAHYDSHWWNAIPAFYMLWGGGAALVVIFLSKWLGLGFLQQKEDYYG